MHPLCLMSNYKGCYFTKELLRKEENTSTQKNQSSRTFRIGEWLTSPLMAAILTLSAPNLVSAPVSFAQPFSNGAKLFEKACIGCHDMGGNILQPVSLFNSILKEKQNLQFIYLLFHIFAQGATLFMKDLQRNGVDTEEGLYNITYYGKGRMPGFGEKCTPRGQCTFGPRLQEDEIKLLAEFVKSQADRGWPNIESYGD
ncbi:cytochrome c6, chloroplastic isoform X2 [Typha latifolia]|uniref:cytochrome c6, chloroplastic isoform X2 n=1 Tax=Typha latifolia TaxID=4733 RepID=UPI003C2D36EB